MRSLRVALGLITLLTVTAVLVGADETHMTSDDYFTSVCSGVWAKGSIPGGQNPFIKVTFQKESKGKSALLMYEWRDFDNIGKINNRTGELQYTCDDEAIAQKLCDASSYGQFLINNVDENTSIFTTAIDFSKTPTSENEGALYKVNETGYYCVTIIPANLENETLSSFDAWVEWKNPYGNLPAADYPKLLFYGVFSLIYLVVGIFWAVQTFRYWRDILPVQHFLSGTIFYLVCEMAINWGYWEAYNQTGKPSYGLLALVAFMNAGRNSMSFFMLLVVCMGYSVVKPSLGSAMKKCIILASTHFFFVVIYSLGIMLFDPETAGFLVLLVIFPLAITMSVFYVWIFSSLSATIATLELRKQHVKARMYTIVHRLLIFSVIMVVVIFILNMFAFSGRNEVDWDANSWQWRWIMLDGLLNVLYFIVFLVIVVLWRPTSNNQRYGLQQISQDEDEAVDLENQLRHAEGLGDRSGDYRTRGLDDDGAIFELGEDDLSDDDHQHDKVKLVSVGNGGNQSPAGENPRGTGDTSITHQNRQSRSYKNSESGGLLDRRDDETDDEIDDDERAHLTRNARK
ncbi:lung seven transmembrane receptor-domain-containing protein [Dichotomocladium elegans]|nr:lung seven transmembrane receptor-domain-containing protein [Dichotomocladium elegans]